jgi:hypothetical protein
VTLDALGDASADAGLASASFRIDGGFTGAHRPPGEVSNLLFTDAETLVWDPERSAGRRRYRASASDSVIGRGSAARP